LKEYRDFLNKLLKTVRNELLTKYRDPYYLKVTGRGAGGDPTLLIDKVSEDVIVEGVREAFPNCTIVSEERGIEDIGRGGPPYVVIDPLDGSVNATRGYLRFSISIAIAEGERLKDVKAGAVIDVRTSDFFEAYEGFGLFVNGRRAKASNVNRLEEALISVPVTHYARTGNLDLVIPLLRSARRVRSLGSTSLEVSYVGAGALDAMVDLSGRARNVDIAAAYLMVKEGGGVITDEELGELDVSLKGINGLSFIAASNLDLARSILSHIRSE